MDGTSAPNKNTSPGGQGAKVTMNLQNEVTMFFGIHLIWHLEEQTMP